MYVINFFTFFRRFIYQCPTALLTIQMEYKPDTQGTNDAYFVSLKLNVHIHIKLISATVPRMLLWIYA